MKKCPRCKKEFYSDIKVCSVCGYEDGNKSAESNKKEFKVCPKCKKQYLYFMDHCIECGYSSPSYKSKMNNLEIEVERPIVKTSYTPKCPTCGSPNIQKISATSKAANTMLFGIFGTKRHKTFKCLNCKYEW